MKGMVMKRRSKVVNLADRKEAHELLKQLYTWDESNEKDVDTHGESGAKSVRKMVESSYNPAEFLLQD